MMIILSIPSDFSIPGYRDTVNDTEEVVPSSLNELDSFLTSTSSSFTFGRDVAINEILDISVRKLIRHGISSPVFYTGEYSLR